MRINADESVKLIAEHNIGDGYHIWNSMGKTDYVNPDNGEDSEIKQTIDTWYQNTIGSDTELDKLVIDTDFCNDRSENYNGVNSRVNNEDPKPTLSCAEERDKVTAKTGLISADEMVYAGVLFLKQIKSNPTYLNNKTFFWTISPSVSARAFDWNPLNLTLGHSLVSSVEDSAARPVITLSSNTLVKTDFLSEDAPGTVNNPYKVVIK